MGQNILNDKYNIIFTLYGACAWNENDFSCIYKFYILFFIYINWCILLFFIKKINWINII